MREYERDIDRISTSMSNRLNKMGHWSITFTVIKKSDLFSWTEQKDNSLNGFTLNLSNSKLKKEEE
jgi:hypothetical protein